LLDVGGAQRERELADELDSHLQMHIDDNLCAGMTPEQARRDAVLRLGGVETTKQAYRERRTLPRWRTCCVTFVCSAAAEKNPGFTVTAVMMLALGWARVWRSSRLSMQGCLNHCPMLSHRG